MRSVSTAFALSLCVSALAGCEGLIDSLEGKRDRAEKSGTTQLGEPDPSDTTTDDYDSGTPKAPVGAPRVAPQPAAVRPDFSITLETKIYTLVVGGAANATAEFSWETDGSRDVLVAIQMKTSVTHPEWTDLLTDLPDTDVGERYGLPGVRQTLWFRAVAVHPEFPGEPEFSEIVRFD